MSNLNATQRAVWTACCEIVGNDLPLDVHANLFDLNMDSLGLAELVIQLEESFGEGCITIDDILANPVVSKIATVLEGGASKEPPAPEVKPVQVKAAAHTTAAPVPTAPALVSPKVVDTYQTAPHVAVGACVDSMASKPVTTPTPMIDPLERILQLESVVAQLTDAVKALATPQNGQTPAVGATPTLSEMLAEKSVSKMGSLTHAVDSCSDCEEEAADVYVDREPRDWILTTHVGSLPRPAGSELAAKDIIASQRASGVSIINDGEWSRENYIADLLSRIQNVGGGESALPASSCLCEMPCAADMRDVMTYAQRFTGGNGLITLNPKRVAKADVACVGFPRYLGGPGLMRNLQPFLDGLAEAGVARESAFWSLPSPGTLALFCEDRFFDGDHTKYVNALAQAVRPEYEAIAATGIKIQIDCPDLAMGRHTRYVDLTDAEFDAVAAANVEALNASLVNVSREQVRIHVCWGNYAGPHHLDLAAYSVWPHVANCHAKFVLIEGANPRHGHEAAAFEHAVTTGLIDPTKFVVVPGVIDTTAARVEHPALVAERLLRFVRAAGHPSRVIASTDCGFASTARSVAITADLAWRKIEALVEGAALATKLYLEAHAPVPTKMPSLLPTPFRVAVLLAGARSTAAQQLIATLGAACSSVDVIAANGNSATASKLAFETMQWAVDFPIALVAVGDTPSNVALATLTATTTAQMLRADTNASRRPSTVFVCGRASAVPHDVVEAGEVSNPKAVAERVSSTMLQGTGFDRRLLAPGTNPNPLPDETEVVVVGGGLLGMAAASRLRAKGHSVVVLEQRTLVGGIWSMHANSTSQVNSSEGGYCLKEFLPESSPRKHAHNRDHSTAAEVLKDLAEMGNALKDVIHTQVHVVQVLGTNGDYHVVCTQKDGCGAVTKVIKASGVVLAINDRVGMPRSLQVPGMDEFKGAMADGTSDQLTGVEWKGKRVVVFGMGAFAVENVRTALESGAAHVTVVARRLGTVCPKMIDYLNFVKPWDEHYRHETATNVKQLKCWRDTYKLSGATTPEVWPGKIKHDGHTISVSDIWFVAHHMGKMCTKVGALERMCADGCVLSDGTMLPCDIVVGCIGFERNTTFCEQLTGRTEVYDSNYLDKNMIYLADAEIDESAFNSFFGSSVLEYAKFYTNVYVEGLERPDKLGPILWGENTAHGPVKLRKWTQYIAIGAELIEKDEACKEHAARQVAERTKHFYQTMPPRTFVEVNRKEWQELHHRLNGGVPVPADRQLPYMFGEAAEWCAPPEQVLV